MVKDLLEERARELGLLFAWAPLDLPQEAEEIGRASCRERVSSPV